MARTGVTKVIDELFTDEELRTQFARDRIGAVTELCFRGVDLTRDEIALLCQADIRLWVGAGEVMAERRH